MTDKLILAAIIFSIITGCEKSIKQADDILAYQIPEIENIEIDGELKDWKNQGYVLKLNTSTSGDIDANDFNADIKLGWDENGLWLNCSVKDDTLIGRKRGIFNNDGLEIFISKKAGTNQMLQYMIPVGKIAGGHDIPIYKYDFRISNPFYDVPDIDSKVLMTPNGYNLETFIPFDELKINPIENPEVFVQFIFRDLDNEETNSLKRYAWYYYDNTYLSNTALSKLVLIDKPVQQKFLPVVPTVNLVDGEMYTFKVVADPTWDGKQIEIKINEQTASSGILKSQNDYSFYEGEVPATNIKELSDRFAIYIDDSKVFTIKPGEVRYVFENKKQLKPERFENEIRIYEQRVSEHVPSENSILFLGSSSIRLWSTLEQDFSDYEVVKCGFGGSRTEDVLFYYDRIIDDYPFQKIVMFCGINDINASISPDTIVKNMEAFIDKTSSRLPGSKILLLSNSVSVSKKQNYDKIIALNESYKKIVAENENVEYIDVLTPMLNPDKGIRPELFSADSTHMSPDGYEIWTKTIKPYLK